MLSCLHHPLAPANSVCIWYIMIDLSITTCSNMCTPYWLAYSRNWLERSVVWPSLHSAPVPLQVLESMEMLLMGKPGVVGGAEASLWQPGPLDQLYNYILCCKSNMCRPIFPDIYTILVLRARNAHNIIERQLFVSRQLLLEKAGPSKECTAWPLSGWRFRHG